MSEREQLKKSLKHKKEREREKKEHYVVIKGWIQEEEDITIVNIYTPNVRCTSIPKANPTLPGGSDSKESASSAGDLCSVPGLEISTGEGNGNPLQYSCLGNPKGRGDW